MVLTARARGRDASARCAIMAHVRPRLLPVVLATIVLLALPGATLVVTLHDVDLALGRFDRVVGLREGRVAFDLPACSVRPGTLAGLYALEPAP
jgi:hypothetical protein